MIKTNQETINSVIWSSCDTFRGIMSSSQYKDYVLTMLFVKYLSDFYKEKLEELNEKYNGKEDRIQKMLKKEKFMLDPECTFDFLYEHRSGKKMEIDGDVRTVHIGELINIVLEKIEDDNKSKLEGVFRNIDFNSEVMFGKTKDRNSMLKHLIEDFADERLDLRPSRLEGNDVIGDAYEFLIAKFASDAGQKGGEFFTPAGVSTLLAKIAGAKEGDRIYDPACGSGSLLIKASKEIGNRNFQIYGQEKNGQTQSLAKMNMFLHQIEDAKIKWGDTLRSPLHLEGDHIMKFDVIVANPPFSLDKWGQEDAKNDKYRRFDYGLPPKSKGDYAFIEHMIASLNQKGTMTTVLPHGVLFRGASEGKIRKELIKENLLDAVIGLPANLFFGTAIPACILVFKKGRANTNVLFIDASKECGKGKNQSNLRPEDIEKIYDTYKNRGNIEKYCHLAELKEIKENDYNLNIPRYVDTFEEEDPVDLDEVVNEIAKLEDKRKGVLKKINKYCEELGIKAPIV